MDSKTCVISLWIKIFVYLLRCIETNSLADTTTTTTATAAATATIRLAKSQQLRLVEDDLAVVVGLQSQQTRHIRLVTAALAANATIDRRVCHVERRRGESQSSIV